MFPPLPHPNEPEKLTFSHFRPLHPTLEQKEYPVKPAQRQIPFAHKHLGRPPRLWKSAYKSTPIQKIAKVEAQFARRRRAAKGRHRQTRAAMSKNVILAIRHATAPQRNGEKWGEKGKTEEKKGSSPISRVLSSGPIRRPIRRAIIPLDDVLPRRSSSLPGDSASSVNVPLFGLAPDGVYRAVTVTSAAVGSYPTVSPLPDLRRAIGGLLSVALSVALTRRL